MGFGWVVKKHRCKYLTIAWGNGQEFLDNVHATNYDYLFKLRSLKLFRDCNDRQLNPNPIQTRSGNAVNCRPRQMSLPPPATSPNHIPTTPTCIVHFSYDFRYSIPRLLKMDLSGTGFNGTEAEYHRLRAEAILNADNVTTHARTDGVPQGQARDEIDGDVQLPDVDNPAHTKQDVNVGLPMSCDPPGPNNPVRQLVWIVSVVSSLLSRFNVKTGSRRSMISGTIPRA